MERASKPFRGLAGALIAVTFALGSTFSLEARAQDAEPAASADAASTAEQPRSRRERRRAAEAAAEAEKAETAQTAAAEPGVSALAETVVREIGDRSKFPAAPQVPVAFPTP